MSSSDVLVNCEQLEVKLKKKTEEKRAVDECNDKAPVPKNQGGKVKLAKDKVVEEKPGIKSKDILHVYDKETLLELRSAAISLEKPDCLSEEFFNKDGVWDPEAWHKSNMSRSASPAVDGKTVLVEGKKLELVDDDIELAPRRRSFRQGCQVQSSGEVEKAEKTTNRVVFERKNRLTGRAASQRRSVENSYNEKSHESEKSRRDKHYDEEKPRYSRYADKESRHPGRDNDRFFERERFDKYNDQRSDPRNEKSKSNKNEKPSVNNSKNSKSGYEEKLPEWMTDGPTSQLDIMEFTGFQDIEEEKKAYAKRRKKVRISPDVDKQNEAKANSSNQKKGSKSVTNEQKDSEKSSDKNFDLNDFFNEVDYYPPHLFHEDLVKGDGVKSRFSQWFSAKRSRSNSCNSGGSRPGSAQLVPEEVFSGVSPKSPVIPTPYFTPIQPAPALVNAAANAHAVQTSNILNIIQEQRHQNITETKKTNREVKGRMTVEDLEEMTNKLKVEENPDASKSAFDMLVMSMKEAGELPDKPAPVVSNSTVTGLPEHLLPQPPKRTSPTFEKLKRILSRSPSPVQMMNAISTVASIISSNPNIDNELSRLSQRKSLTPSPVPMSTFFDQNSDNVNTSANMPAATPDADKSSTLNQGSAPPKRMSTAFTPTSVLKKIYNEKQRESPIPYQQDVSFSESNKNTTYEEIFTQSVHSQQTKLSKMPKDAAPTTPERSVSGVVHGFNESMFHSAPTTPKQHLNLMLSSPGQNHSQSVPNTPDHYHQAEPPSLHRVIQPPGMTSKNHSEQNGSAFTPTKPTLLAPSDFQGPIQDRTKGDVGVIGSGIPKPQNDFDTRTNFRETRGVADPRLAPGNGATRSGRSFIATPNDPSLAPGNPLRPLIQSTPMPPQQHMHQSQQRQLLQSQIQQKQLIQQQKLRQIAQQANQQKLLLQQSKQNKMLPNASAVRPLLPDPDGSGKFPRSTAEHNASQQQQQQQILAYQQQHQQQLMAQQQQTRMQGQFPNTNFRGRQFQPPHTARNSLPIPMPMQQPGMTPLHNMNQPRGMPNFAAQALAQQQLLQQARARFIAQAQLMQQPQVVQAALMAQAALARGQAQAQAAMMLHPRNLQAMAEQMGIRPPFNKAIPTPMVPQSSVQQGNTTGNVNPSGDETLSKWFSPDVLQHIPQNKSSSDAPGGKIMSVEELEKTQRSF
ncbi:eukaryotic translation initiation factor 4E transporter-like isoform X1 [Hydractinia symbiolongicarpus]|uniref:eukaryotic translation initiation factor 4E transporter-like isoform X1 n=1 Tax=Hydractinia symbiolongicarpus TaxID=13093 RepID=UPI00254B0E49|nr:eukaryotic translation initiation factor 4E transporter-like isoform X1 [Hydractinia symbiolongicarpus]